MLLNIEFHRNNIYCLCLFFIAWKDLRYRIKDCVMDLVVHLNTFCHFFVFCNCNINWNALNVWTIFNHENSNEICSITFWTGNTCVTVPVFGGNDKLTNYCFCSGSSNLKQFQNKRYRHFIFLLYLYSMYKIKKSFSA